MPSAGPAIVSAILHAVSDCAKDDPAMLTALKSNLPFSARVPVWVPVITYALQGGACGRPIVLSTRWRRRGDAAGVVEMDILYMCTYI